MPHKSPGRGHAFAWLYLILQLVSLPRSEYVLSTDWAKSLSVPSSCAHPRIAEDLLKVSKCAPVSRPSAGAASWQQYVPEPGVGCGRWEHMDHKHTCSQSWHWYSDTHSWLHPYPKRASTQMSWFSTRVSPTRQHTYWAEVSVFLLGS